MSGHRTDPTLWGALVHMNRSLEEAKVLRLRTIAVTAALAIGCGAGVLAITELPASAKTRMGSSYQGRGNVLVDGRSQNCEIWVVLYSDGTTEVEGRNCRPVADR
jgi:hypothetical protein